MGEHESTTLLQRRSIDARWRLSTRAVGLDLSAHEVVLANGERGSFDRLVIATGTRARPWGRPHRL